MVTDHASVRASVNATVAIRVTAAKFAPWALRPSIATSNSCASQRSTTVLKSAARSTGLTISVHAAQVD